MNGERNQHHTGFFEEIKAGLIRTKENIGRSFDQLFAGELNDDFYDELEEAPILGGAGMDIIMKAVEELRRQVRAEKTKGTEGVRMYPRRTLTDVPQMGEPTLKLDTTSPVALSIGVSGVSKTTTVGELSARMKGEGHRVLIVAADTFQAVTVDQPETRSERSGVKPVHQYEGVDLVAVVSNALTAAKARSADVVLIDTAGWLHDKQNLMSESSKTSRAVDRELPGCDRETLLVLNTTTGQNNLIQAKQSRETAGTTGIVLTKLDGSAKGGIITATAQEFQVPVKLIDARGGIGDLMSFKTERFVEALV